MAVFSAQKLGLQGSNRMQQGWDHSCHRQAWPLTQGFRTQFGKVQESWDQIEGLKKQAERQQQDVARAEAALAKAKEDLENLPNAASQDQSQSMQDLDALKAEIRDLSAQACFLIPLLTSKK